MSSLIGIHGERWSLARAIDAMADAARQAGKPGLHWIAGLLYPSVTLGFSATAPGVLSAAFEHLGFSPHSTSFSIGDGKETTLLIDNLFIAIAGFSCLGVLFFPMFRFVAGLARIAPSEAWRDACAGHRVPRLSAVWKAGVGLTLSTFGLWVQFQIMMLAALIVIALPAALAARPFLAGGALHDMDVLKVFLACTLLGPLALFFLLYTLSISVMTQLGLHSLAHNRRGVGSALLHAWRIMQHDAWATARAIVVDVVLSASILLIWKVFDSVVPVEWLSMTVYVTLMGFLGVARAAYWARAYRALGGLSPDDGVPGLANPSTAWN